VSLAHRLPPDYPAVLRRLANVRVHSTVRSLLAPSAGIRCPRCCANLVQPRRTRCSRTVRLHTPTGLRSARCPRLLAGSTTYEMETLFRLFRLKELHDWNHETALVEYLTQHPDLSDAAKRGNWNRGERHSVRVGEKFECLHYPKPPKTRRIMPSQQECSFGEGSEADSARRFTRNRASQPY